MRLRFPFVLVGVLLAMLLPGMAMSNQELSEADYLGEIPVVLSATRLRQPLSEAPAAMTIIDRQMIKDSGAWDVADLFRLVPGMYVAYNVDKEFVPGHVVSYHGMADPYAKRMQILVDGRSVYTPMFGGPVWSNLPLALDDIERVEVVRGPSAATYGANSFLGVINIITRDPAETHGNHVSLASGKPGADATYRYGGGGADSDWRLTAQWRDDRGYTATPDKLEDGRKVYGRNDDKEIHNLALRTSHRLTARDEVQLHFGYSGGTRGAGDLDNRYLPFHEKRVHSQYEMLQWQHTLAADNQLSLRFFHNRDSLSQDLSGLIGTTPFGVFTLAAPAPLNHSLSHVAERYDFELQHVFSPSDATRLVWGAGSRRDLVRSEMYFNSNDMVRFGQVNAFANLEWRPHAAWVVNFGTMAEKNDFTGTHLSPRLGINFHVATGHTLRAIASRAYRNPVLFEQKGDSRWQFTSITPVAGLTMPLRYLYGRDNLQPERIDSREAGYLVELGHGGSFDVKVSRDRIRDLIEMYQFRCSGAQMTQPQCVGTTSGTDVRIFDNRSAVSVDALELQWQQRLWQRTQLHAGWASTRVRPEVGPSGEAYEHSAPRHSWNLLLAHQFDDHWRGSVAGYYVKTLEALGGHAVPSYTRWDTRLARSFRLAGVNVEAALVAQNVSGKDFREFYRDNAFGRRLWANLKLDF